MGSEAEDKGKLNVKKKDNLLIEDQLLKPFNHGWKREVVMRVITANNNCDVYYLHPSGKKLRSMIEVKANLTDGLTPDCFTFKKVPLNVSSEIVRTASVRGKRKKKGIDDVTKSNSQAQMLMKNSNVNEKEKSSHQRANTRRQTMIKKSEAKNKILEIKNSKNVNGVPEKKNITKTVEKKGTRRTTKYNAPSGKQSKTEINKKAALRKSNTVKRNAKESTASKIKIDNINGGRKRELNDIKTIVKRNIGKYRELRKKQIMGKMKEGLREKTTRNVPYNVIERSRRSEPISKNLYIYLKPLERGWRRELVHRVNGLCSAGRSDVYYFHPSGKKLRSIREISKNLTQGLTLECFTFRKEALGCGAPQEIVRNARLSKTGMAAN